MERSKFAGGDQAYLRDEQYRDSSRLGRRADLHARYSTATEPWFDFVVDRVALDSGSHVLDTGCGPAWLWELNHREIPPGVRIVLSDLSAGMVGEAVARVISTGQFERVDGRAADLQSLPFEDGRFDRIVANHMLYHLPEPARGVAELARVVRSDGRVVAATNGRRHMRELWAIRGEVFDIEPVDRTVDVFGAEVGFATLRDHFARVEWHGYIDELHCTDPNDVMAYVCSTPPAEDATAEQLAALESHVFAAFEAGGGAMKITKDAGCFVCTGPLH